MLIFGIDPGLTGAIALWDSEAGGATVWDMPVVAKAMDVHVLHDLLHRGQGKHSLAMVERQQAMPGQGVSSTFRAGGNYASVLTTLTLTGIPFTLVSPARWKRAMGLNQDKEASRAMALQLFPYLADKLSRKKDEGRAEALLLMEYGRREHSHIHEVTQAIRERYGDTEKKVGVV